ncbi:redoxin family protein [Roseivirga seohaensis]|uniref:redoxin family protein n=1 Tax=Roseivirga seohaensis TaxID=1914963 RepID=UPI003BAC1755
MKNLIQKTTSLLLLTAVLFACKSEVKVAPDSFTVTGTLKGLDTEFMTRSYKDAEGNRVSDSIFVENGKFTYTAKISEPEFIVFWPNVENTIKRTDRGYYPAKSSQFAFLAAPGDYIEFKGEVTDFVNAYPTGTPANDDLASINSKIFPLLNQAVNMQLEQNKLEDTDPRYQVLTDSMNLLNEKVDEMKKAFVASNPKSQAAAWYLSDMMVRSQVSQDEAIKIFKSFDKSLEGYTYYEAVAQRVEGIESTMEGKIIPNFTSNATPNGETFELYSLKGKYVLVDFWGTWCAPCIAEMPTVKEYQEKYKDQLVILGINSGDSMEKMVQFLDKYDYDWQQVLAQSETEDLVLKLNVAGFPTKFILDPEGKIIKRFVGSTEEAFDVLDEILE